MDQVSTETIVGVAPINAPVENIVVERPARRVGASAEAALRERAAKAKADGAAVLYSFRGKDYRVITPMPAGFMIHATQVNDEDGINMKHFVNAIKSAFVGDDGQKLLDAITDTTADVVADAEFLNDVLTEIVEAVTDRPFTS